MNTSFKQALKARAHHLKPVILMGEKGLTKPVIDETDIALIAHELIKVKISGIEKGERLIIAQELCQQLKAELVQMIGNIAIIFRKNEQNK